MTTNVYLIDNIVIGGVYDSSKEAYTIFLEGGGLCVLPRRLVETYITGETPEERLYYIRKYGIYSDPRKKSNKQPVKEKEENNKSFLNLRDNE